MESLHFSNTESYCSWREFYHELSACFLGLFLGLDGDVISAANEVGRYISGRRCHKADFPKTTDVMGFKLEELLYMYTMFGGIDSCKMSEINY